MLFVGVLGLQSACNTLMEKTPITIGFEDCSVETDRYSIVTTMGHEDRIYVHANQGACGGKTTVCQERSIEQVTVEAPTEFVVFQEMVTVNRDLVYFPYRVLQEGEETITFNVSTTDGSEVVYLDLKVITNGHLSSFGQCTNLSAEPQSLIVMEGTYDLAAEWIEVTEEDQSHLPALSVANSSMVSISSGERSSYWMCSEESTINFTGIGQTDLLLGDDQLVAQLTITDQYDGYHATRFSTEESVFNSICLTKTLGTNEICYSNPVSVNISNQTVDNCELISPDDDLPMSTLSIVDTVCFDLRTLTDQPCRLTVSNDQQEFMVTVE